MAHFAQIGSDDKTVMQVIVINNEAIDGGVFPASEPKGQEFISQLGLPGVWLQCSYSGSFRGAFPGESWTYSTIEDVFLPPVDEPSYYDENDDVTATP